MSLLRVKLKQDLYNNKKIILWIIDFYLNKYKLKLFVAIQRTY